MVDPYNKLRMEYNSICSIIKSYTSGAITWYLMGLKEAIDAYKKEDILYYLGRINKWYEDNIVEIKSCDFTFDSDRRAHIDNKKFLEEIYVEIENYDFGTFQKNISAGGIKHNGTKKIFLSHRSTDKKYADALERFLIGLGVKNEQLIYTSHPLHKIPLGQKIYDYLRENINDQVFMIILWSNDYLDSPACVGEMGAAWVAQTEYIGIYCPDFSFGNPKYHEVPIDTTKMGAVLNGDANCKASMIEFKNKIQNFFGLEDDEQNSAYILDQFMKDIQQE